MSATKEQKTHAHDHIAFLLQHLVQQYKGLAAERRLLHTIESDKDYSTLGVIELYSTYVSGYATQIIDRLEISNPKRALQELATWDFFSVDYCYNWFYDKNNQLNGLKLHVLQLDYLRLIIAEYLRKHQLTDE